MKYWLFGYVSEPRGDMDDFIAAYDNPDEAFAEANRRLQLDQQHEDYEEYIEYAVIQEVENDTPGRLHHGYFAPNEKNNWESEIVWEIAENNA